jgi:superfamily II DNA/RNA helicase
MPNGGVHCKQRQLYKECRISQLTCTCAVSPLASACDTHASSETEFLYTSVSQRKAPVYRLKCLVRSLRLSTSATVLVFCRERIECERVTRLLLKNPARAEGYHGGISDKEAVETRTREDMPYRCTTHVHPVAA